jgi:hypothetical protein
MNSDETNGAKTEYQGAEAEQGEGGLADRILSVFIAPREVAASLARRPEWIRALLIVAVIMAASAVLVSRESASFSREMMTQSSRVELTDQQLARISEVSTKTYVSKAIGGLVWAGVQTLLYALVLFLVGKAVGGRARFRQVFSVASYAGLIGALGAVVTVAVVKLTGTFPVETSLGVLAGDSYWSLARVALGNFEIFWIWQLVVLTIALGVVQGLSTAKAAVSTGVLFLLRLVVLVGITAATRGFLGVA